MELIPADEANVLILGMVTARHTKTPGDSAKLIDSFMEDTVRMGVTDEMAMSILFNASLRWVDTLMNCRAEHHGITHQQAVQELSLLLVGEPCE